MEIFTDKSIRLVTNKDSHSLLQIYSYYIDNTAVTFECEIPSVINFAERIKKISANYPWIVCQLNNCIAGYAYAAQYSERAAYRWSVVISVYVKQEYHRKGIAGALYTSLLEILKLQRYYNAFAGITLPNISSEKLHEHFGFKPVGIFTNAGYKLGKWHDVIYYQLTIGDNTKAPEEPISIQSVKNTAKINSIFKKSIDLIKG